MGRVGEPDEVQPGGDGLRVLQKGQPQRGQDEGQDGDQHPGQAQVGAGDRGEVIVVRLLDDIKDGGGEDHGCRGIVHQDDDIAL